MDISKLKNKAAGLFSKYKYVLLVLLVGIALIFVPNDTQESSNTYPINTITEESYLENDELL